jgi:hypothetical protein
LPPELHRKLVKAAGPASSLNSEIVRRLERGVEMGESISKLLADTQNHVREMTELVRASEKRIGDSEKRIREAENQIRQALLKRTQKKATHPAEDETGGTDL